MGNRAVITFSGSRSTGVGIYLHWNGGLESVLAFLDAVRSVANNGVQRFKRPSGFCRTAV